MTPVRSLSALTLAPALVLGLAAAPAPAAEPVAPVAVRGWATHHDTSPPLADIAVRVAGEPGFAREVPIGAPPERARPDDPGVPDPVRQDAFRPPSLGPTPPPDLSVEGLSEQDNRDVVGFSVVPPDTEGDVGPNFYMQWVNLVWGLFDKTTGALTDGPFAGNSFWQGFGGNCESTNDGDPIVLYDDEAGRWVVSQFAIDSGTQCVAVSATGDPLGSYHRYEFVVTPGGNNDYPKLGVWADGTTSSSGQSAYTFTTRDFTGFFTFNLGSGVMERDAMLAGQPAQFVKFVHPCTSSDCVEGLLPPHLAGPPPPAGTCPTYWAASDTQFDADGPWSVDGYRNYTICADWADLPSTTFVENQIVAGSPFDRAVGNGFSACVPTPGEDVDCLAIFTMYRAQYRWFGDRASVVLNHTVDANGADLNAIRWAEVESTDGQSAWSLAQDGTYSPDGDHRWMGSIAQDQDGNVALGYSVASNSLNPAVRYTSRMAGDAPGTMPGGEVSCHEGTGAQVSSAGRWGDYSTMSVDPDDDCTFWYTTEYYETTTSFDFKTRICSFRFAECGDGGGGIPCEDVRGMRAVCRQGGQGNGIIARVRMTDSSHDGESVTLSIDGTPFPATIQGDRAILRERGFASGDHTVSLTDPAGCVPDQIVTCP